MNDKQLIFFDVDGVLIHGYSGRPELRVCWDEDLEADFGISRQMFSETFIRGVFEKEVLTGGQDLAEALATWLALHGYDDVCAHDLVRYWLEKDSCINEDIIPYLETLSQSGNVRLFIATNQEHNRARYLMDELGFGRYFEDIFHSAQMGALKTDPKYFQTISGQLNIRPGQRPIFFDDSRDVVDVASAHGWDAIEFIHAQDVFKSDTVRALLGSVLQ